mgnify:CR=1 FL=1
MAIVRNDTSGGDNHPSGRSGYSHCMFNQNIGDFGRRNLSRALDREHGLASDQLGVPTSDPVVSEPLHRYLPMILCSVSG